MLLRSSLNSIKVSLYAFKMTAGERGALHTLQLLKISLVCKSLAHSKQPPTHLECWATFLRLSLPSVYKSQLCFIFYVYFLPSPGDFLFSLLLERKGEKKRERERAALIGCLPPAPGL